MLVFKARPRKSPNLAETITPSQRRIMRLLMDARDRVQDSIVLRDLEDRIDHRSAVSTANSVTVDPWIDMQQDLADELYTEYVDAGRRAQVARPLTKQNTTIDMALDGYGYVPLVRFDADRTQARDWADKEAAALIREITDEQREVIREVIVRSTQGEYTVSQIARQVRGTIGLTSQQAGWVENFRQRQIDAAIERGVPAERAPSAVQGEVDKYHKRIHRYRSETIARTETIRASSEGRQAAWQQGMDDGFISPDAEKRWIVEFDGCSICMGNGITGWINIKDTWSTGDPPAHPNCRCDVILRDDPVDDLTEMSDEELAAEIQSLIDGQAAPEAGVSQLPPVNDVDAVRRLRDDDWIAQTPEIERLRSEYYETNDAGGGYGYAMQKVTGYDRSANVVERDQLDALINDGWQEVHRGVTTSGDKTALSMFDDFTSGEFFPGLGIYGNGTYSSTAIYEAADYAGGNDGVLMRLAVNPKARVADSKAILEEQRTYRDRMGDRMPEYLNDVGYFAMSRGYQAIRNEGTHWDNWIILDRGVVAVERSPQIRADLPLERIAPPQSYLDQFGLTVDEWVTATGGEA